MGNCYGCQQQSRFEHTCELAAAPATENLQRITASPEDNDVDEIVANTVDIHLERMDDGLVWFALYRQGSDSSLHFWISAVKKGEARVSAYWSGDPWPDIRHEIREWEDIDVCD